MIRQASRPSETLSLASEPKIALGEVGVWKMSQDNVVALRPNDRVRQDAEPIATICRNLGATTAAQVVARALDEVSQMVAGLNALVKRHDLAEMPRPLRRLQRMAENLGLITLGLVAADLTLCITCQDVTAISAVWARLVRVAENALADQRSLLGATLA